MELECLRDGEVIARTPLELPGPDPRGRIPYLGSMPVENLNPGRYEIRAVARQGSATAEEHVFFTVSP